MPEYDLSDEKVKVTVIGKVLDLDFARVLARNPDLRLEEIISLDKVQKKKELRDDDAQYLKKIGLIEGRKPNYYISSKIALSTSDHNLKAQYIKNRGFDDSHYRKLIVEFLRKYQTANRKEFNTLLFEKLPDILSDKQKKTKIANLLLSLRKDNKIINVGSDKKPLWRLVDAENTNNND